MIPEQERPVLDASALLRAASTGGLGTLHSRFDMLNDARRIDVRCVELLPKVGIRMLNEFSLSLSLVGCW